MFKFEYEPKLITAYSDIRSQVFFFHDKSAYHKSKKTLL